MNILFITSSRIGDAVLSTGLLNYMVQRWPESKIIVACGPLATSLFEGCPNVVKVIALKKQKYNKHWAGLWQQTVGRKWDVVVDLRNSLVSRLIFSRKKHIFGRHIDKTLHKVQQNASVMNLEKPPASKLWFTDKQEHEASELVPDAKSSVLAVGPAANWEAKTWPAEHFIAVIKAATHTGGILPGARLAIFAAPGEEEVAYRVLNSVPKNKQIDVIAKCDPGTAAAALARCDLYIGNDSGLMHCAAAVGVPTLGLFGPSYPEIYGPWGDKTTYASTPETFDELISYEGYDSKAAPCLMKTLTVDKVVKEMEELWTNA